jgi:hypothetical protein
MLFYCFYQFHIVLKILTKKFLPENDNLKAKGVRIS